MVVGLYIKNCRTSKEIPLLYECLAEGYDVIVFVNEFSQIEDKEVCVMHASDLWKFRHPVVALDEEAARFLQNCPVPLKRFTTCDTIEIEGLFKLKSIKELETC